MSKDGKDMTLKEIQFLIKHIEKGSLEKVQDNRSEAEKKEKNLTLKIDDLEKELNQEKQKAKEVVKNSSSNESFNDNFEKIFNDFKKISENEKKRIEVIITEKKRKRSIFRTRIASIKFKIIMGTN